ncbi:MAG: peptidylprolyl isomerase [Planctomycetaceae bacterium]
MVFRTVSVLTLLVSALVVSGCQSPASRLKDMWSKRDTDLESTAPPRRPSGEQSGPGRVRLSLDKPQTSPQSAAPSTSGIELTEFSPNREFIEFDGATVVATANSMPIFASDVLEPYYLNIRRAAEQLNDAEINSLKAKIIQEHLHPHIEKAVLVSALQRDLDEEQLGQLEQQLDSAFKEEIERLKKQAKVVTRVELEQVLEQEGVRLDTLKSNFTARQMAMYYIGQKASSKTQYSRQELLDWYTRNREQYAIKALARSQQIRVGFAASGGRTQAAEKMQQVVGALRNGEDFGDVAGRLSDGPRKSKKGIWDWTAPNSLAEANVDQALWQVDVDRISQVLETQNAFVLVKVLERKGGGYKPFEDVQDEINRKLVNDSRTTAASKVIQELIASATISTVFDAPAEASPGGSPRPLP